MNIVRLIILTMIVVLLFFGIRNTTALITYIPRSISIAALVAAIFLIFVVLKTWKDR